MHLVLHRSVNTEGQILPPFWCWFTFTGKSSRKPWAGKRCSFAKRHCFSRPVGWTKHFKVPGANLPDAAFSARITHRASAKSHFMDRSDFLKETGWVEHSWTGCETCVWDPEGHQDNNHISPQGSSKIIYTVPTLDVDFTCWLGKFVSIGKAFNPTHLCSHLFTF